MGSYLSRRTDFHIRRGARTRARLNPTLTRAAGRRTFSLSQRVPREGWRVVGYFLTNAHEGPFGPYGMWLENVRVHVARRRAASFIEGTLLDVAPGPLSLGSTPAPHGWWGPLPRLRYVDDRPRGRFELWSSGQHLDDAPPTRIAREFTTAPLARVDAHGVSIARGPRVY